MTDTKRTLVDIIRTGTTLEVKTASDRLIFKHGRDRADSIWAEACREASPEPPFDSEAELHDLLATWDVHVLDDASLLLVSAVNTGLVDALLDWAKRSAS